MSLNAATEASAVQGTQGTVEIQEGPTKFAQSPSVIKYDKVFGWRFFFR
jgi:hypothetical protein